MSFNLKHIFSKNKGNTKCNIEEVNEKKHNILNYLYSLRPDLSIDEINDIIIDENSYYRAYKDVADSKLKAGYHYFKYGILEKRNFPYPKQYGLSKTVTLPLHNDKSVFYTNAKKDNASFLYRMKFAATDEILITWESELYDILVAIFSSKKITILRPVFDSRTLYIIKLSKYLGLTVAMDFDDLLLPEYIESKGEIRSLMSDKVKAFEWSEKNSAIFNMADEYTCSTEVIKEKFASFGKPVSVVNNKLPKSLFKNIEAITSKWNERVRAIENGSKVNILYLSGSETHKKDYSIINGLLMNLAQQMPEKFSISFFGKTHNYCHVFNLFNVETKKIEFMEFEDMLNEISLYDVVLVPLEETIFNDAKSNIKYIEAATQGVPVIASSRKEFCKAINHDENGWLCSSDSEWINVIQNIIKNPKCLMRNGLKAYEKCWSQYSI